VPVDAWPEVDLSPSPSPFSSAVAFGLLVALIHMGPQIPPGTDWDAKQAMDRLVSLGLLQWDDARVRVVPAEDLSDLIRPHLSTTFAERPSTRDFFLLCSLVVVAAHVCDDDAAWAEHHTRPAWHHALLAVAVERLDGIQFDAFDGAPQPQ
jgi:hypothetical protein